MSATFTELLTPTKSEKRGAIIWDRATDNAASPVAGTPTITGTRDHCRYRVEEFVADDGRGFMLFELDAGTDRTEERYACLVGTRAKGCECRGYASTGKCKHLAALLTLVEAGKL
ncbi:hypothetical protein [Frigoriglobus tundricola]|uniref:SWIM-type domain-containing protein n=1 Tax=Frigoriglobus tundricola TaxID=2774151 RepID=A0A6M5Z1K8_9BACT|nr:hypothetical protein [Frigoriglobus tundricola]QJX00049.1 hypothetical protein FTUN_7672 [Frigoriglobus tundricola]